MINTSKRDDIKKGRYDPDEHIDRDLLQYQFEEQEGKCFYCEVAMVTHSSENGKIDPDRMSIERMDNRVGHIKENCILACYKCNCQRQDRYDCNEFYRMKAGERELNNV